MTDPYTWLEDVEGERALEWARARNAEAAESLAAAPEFAETRERILEVLDSSDRIPAVSKVGRHYYNFWRDDRHERGLWRRTTPESYASDRPDWETVLDLDALGEQEGVNWVWHGASILRGDDEFRLALVDLSRGGSDADVTREFDLERKAFVEGGFTRPEAKGSVSWIDEDTVFVATDTGEGSMTASGYPRLARRWTRGAPLAEAPIVYEGEEADMSIHAVHDSTPGFERDLVIRMRAFYDAEFFLLGDGDEQVRIDVPRSAEPDLHREWLTVRLRDAWSVGGRDYAGGSLLAIRLEEFLAGDRRFRVLFEPDPRVSLVDAVWTREHLVLTTLEDVKSRVRALRAGDFEEVALPGLPEVGTIDVRPVDAKTSEAVWITTTDFLSPTALSIAEIGTGEAPRALKSQPELFDASGLVATQRFATSEDGTRVPYFLVHRGDLPPDGGTPTLQYAYGGFEISLTPEYNAALGRAWLERGGAYALANIRGGGEYGPAWHQAALKRHRHRAYEDMAAVSRDLIDRGLTSPERLGIRGGSNGGLLTGNMLVREPGLYGAVVVEVPLLDMKRYSHLLAGASWMAEYGDPDTADWEFIRTFSPYHLFDPEADYPPVLFTTSTRDDRVHPAHARKMVAAMLAAGKDVTYYENIEGGHGGAATNEQSAHVRALVYRFLAERLGLG
ncbi:prolyl oligopeptidase family protein [Gulosibacter sp. 10]|uniref:prolyl oligopeptidase family serine peptidase n=1 Tax=Gulosibacter sp. 10 TaxID=1255570 RepID=UPI00097EAD81|nr:prolyl oligopeptidase family serine peptidase [Gulosibacter sp. 10]SJM53657.1 Prolyl endopeptidase [Gulosibacter sp. 10]